MEQCKKGGKGMFTKEEKDFLRLKVKKANQRLRELEKNGYWSSSLAYKYIEKQAYDNDKALKRTRHGEIKFDTNISALTHNELTHLESVVDDFLKTKTSTKRGFLKALEESYKSFKNKVNQDFSIEEYKGLFELASLQEFNKLYGSKELERLTHLHGVEKAQKIVASVMAIYKKTGIQPSIIEVDNIANSMYTSNESDNPFT